MDQPRLALQRAFGVPAWAVGDCDREVASRFERHLPDDLPGAGPIAGIVAALMAADRPVVVLSGDLPAITAEDLRMLLAAAERNPAADAALAVADEHAPVEPCIGLYRPSVLPHLRSALGTGKTPSLRGVLEKATVFRVPLDPRATRNANTIQEL